MSKIQDLWKFIFVGTILLHFMIPWPWESSLVKCIKTSPNQPKYLKTLAGQKKTHENTRVDITAPI